MLFDPVRFLMALHVITTERGMQQRLMPPPTTATRPLSCLCAHSFAPLECAVASCDRLFAAIGLFQSTQRIIFLSPSSIGCLNTRFLFASVAQRIRRMCVARLWWTPLPHFSVSGYLCPPSH